jgi:hypothetical protein
MDLETRSPTPPPPAAPPRGNESPLGCLIEGFVDLVELLAFFLHFLH